MKIFSRQSIIYYWFILLFIIGLYFSKDFGVSWDEHYHRKQGKQTIAYVAKVFGVDDFISIPKDLKDPEIGIGGYGPIFEIFCLISEKLFSVDDIKNKYLLKHKINFSIYFIGVFLFYLFLKKNFANRTLGLVGAMFYFLNPRVFAHGFFNPKDSISQALLACSLLPLFLSYKNKNISMSVLSGFLIGIAITIRLPIIYLPFLFILVMILNSVNLKSTLMHKKNYRKVIICFTLSLVLSVFLFFPHLWDSPINNIYTIFNNLNKIQWSGNNLFGGELIPASNVPWYYIPTWIFITTPITFIFFLIVGISKLISDLYFYKNENNLFKIFMFFGFFSPIIVTILLNSTLYTGWRHLFFIYPFIAYFMTYGFKIISEWVLTKYNLKLLYVIIFLSFINPIYYIFISHPNQQIYFNKFAGPDPLESFEGDYWAVSMRQALDWIVENDNREHINVSSPINVASKNNVMLNEKFRKKLNYLPIEPVTFKNKTRYNNNRVSKDGEFEIPVNYLITNSRMEKEGFTLNNKNEVFSVNSGKLKLWSVYRIN